MNLSKLTEEQRRELALAAYTGIDAVVSETAGKTYTLIQEEAIDTNHELLDNPFIFAPSILIGVLMDQVRIGAFSTVIGDGGFSLKKSSQDISSFSDFVLLGDYSQGSLVMELCWLQAAHKKAKTYTELNSMALQLFSKTWKQKQTLFRVIDPSDLRVYYRKVLDPGESEEEPKVPQLLMTT